MMPCVRALSALALLLALGACGTATLKRVSKPGLGPDEYLITPGRPLQAPADVSALPTPAGGAPNVATRNPVSDAIVALGGNPNARPARAQPAEAALGAHLRRHGVDPQIRARIAAEDADLRGGFNSARVVKLGGIDAYTYAYRGQWLDSRAEADRLRRAGVSVPAVPPQ